jgi:hypothetical protein
VFKSGDEKEESRTINVLIVPIAFRIKAGLKRIEMIG